MEFCIYREAMVSFLGIRMDDGTAQTIAHCRSEWLPVDGPVHELAGCHEWNFYQPDMLGFHGETVVRKLEASRYARIDRRRDRFRWNESNGPLCERAYWMSRIGEPVPHI